MEQVHCKLTVFFEDPFWVGVYERWENGLCTACKLTFGAEPKDAEVFALVLNFYHRLKFSPPVPGELPSAKAPNPKRAQRQAKRELAQTGVGTKAQQALALQRGQGKEARKKRSREEKEAQRQRQFDLKQEKRREKHRGR